jgi:DNA-binding NtrC family response regulator
MVEPIVQLKRVSTENNNDQSSVAIIDDDLSFTIMLKEYLFSQGEIKSMHYSSGEDFLKEYKPKDERKIILDFDFGKGMNGLSILKKIKSINPEAAVIMVSSLDELETALDTIRKGATDYFLKSNKTVFANIHCSLKKIMEMERNKWN